MAKAILWVWRENITLRPMGRGGKEPCFIDRDDIDEQVKQLARFFSNAIPGGIADEFAKGLGLDEALFWHKIHKLADEN
jgi:hypothetical protein